MLPLCFRAGRITMDWSIHKNTVLCLLWGGWAIGLVGYTFYNCLIYLLFVPALFFLFLFFMLIKTMFKKRADSNNSVSSVVNVAVQTGTVLSGTQQDLAKTNTIIASGTVLKGNINLEGDIQIYGIVIGDISVTEGTIKLMRSGNIEGNLTATHITVDGCINGVCVSEHLEILEHGRLKGIVKGSNFSIKKGGVFIGQSEISEETNDAKDKAKPAISKSSAHKEKVIVDQVPTEALAKV